MERHRREQAEASQGETYWLGDEPDPRNNEDDDNRSHARELLRPDLRHRRSSDPTSSRPLVHRSRPSWDDSASNSSDDIEDLPDRFDHQGRPLDEGTTSQGRWTTRQGTFRRERQRPGGWDVQGAWKVGGTDGEAVERLVRNLTSALDGQKSWMGVLGDVLGSGLLSGAQCQGRSTHQNHDRPGFHEDDDEESNYGWRRRRGTRR